MAQCAMCDGPAHGAKEPHVFKGRKAEVKLSVVTEPVKTVKTNVKTKGMTNAERQRKWQRDHRDEFNKRRRDRYQSKRDRGES